MFSVVFLLLLSVFLILIYFYLRRKFQFWSDLQVPHIKPENWLLGNLQGVGRRNVAEYFGSVYEDLCAAGQGPIAGFYFFTQPALLVTEPSILRELLVKDFDFFHDRGIYVNEADDPLSAHLFSLEGQRWRQLRAKLTPTFTSGKMKIMFGSLVDVAEEFKAVLQENIGQDLEFKDLCSRLTIDIIGRCAFGIECEILPLYHRKETLDYHLFR